MTWTQNYDPFNNIALSALVAAIPIFFLFWALAIKKMKGYIAGLLTLLLAIIVVIFEYKMPVNLALMAAVNGALYGLFPIGWIVITAVYLYNLTVKAGQFEIIKDSIASITEDRRLQALLIAFAFGAFLEGAAGFGTPVAITAAMLVGLGFNPLYAAGICLIANTAPVAFGGIGIPIIVAGQVTGIDAMAISKMVGRQLPLLSVAIPAWLVFIMSGWKGLLEVLPAVLVTGISFAGAQWFSANYLSPMLPDIISSLVSIIALVLFLKVWKPKNIWRFANEPPATLQVKKHSAGAILKAWSPFIVLTILVGDWGLNQVKNVLDLVTLKFHVPGLDGLIYKPGADKAMEAVFKFNWLSAAGTAILIAAIITILILRISFKDAVSVFVDTLKSLKYPLINIAAVLGFAYVANFSGMSQTLGLSLTVTGKAFAFLSPMLGWLGVFITGSDTSANALFAKLQAASAEKLGIDPVLTVAANSSGGVTGKMISPQSIAVATASVGLVGKEAELFRFTVLHSFLFAVVVGIITYLQAYYLKSWIPVYKMIESAGAAAQAQVETGPGLTILGITAVVILALWGLVAALNKK
ncbi:L-lactate permease [Carboxydothermus hydrogenoformans]|uniref:L-lactate permease n=1 Tax=Carboxydothermus hydrogenoformans (strain ATCC BAA-161 / DSM 6008 / Z-2901) TaxID=246194 RepID=Q3AEZ2_CARHZ|nr:L-lactate/glycolate permease [Carboxydothermus hydrogenoformans Z-2901]